LQQLRLGSRRRGPQVLEEELVVAGLGRVEQRDRIAAPQLLATILADQSAVDVRAVGAQVVKIDVVVLVRATDLAVLAAASAQRGGPRGLHKCGFAATRGKQVPPGVAGKEPG